MLPGPAAACTSPRERAASFRQRQGQHEIGTNTTIAPPRTIGFLGAALFPVNGMIGAGIFALPAVLVAAVGAFGPWMMLIGGVLFLPLILVFAWLAMRFEHSGGPVLYGQAAFGGFVGFQSGWARYASNIVTLAANTHVMVSYLAALFPVLEGPVARPAAVGLFIMGTALINLLGMRKSVGTLGLFTFIKLAPLFVLVGAALMAGGTAGEIALPRFGEIESVVLLTYYAFMGFEQVVLPAGEFRRPRRDVPLALLTTLAAVTALYMAVIWAYLAISPQEVPGQDALAAAAGAVLGDFGTAMIVVAAAFSIGGNNFSAGIAVPRMTYGMAEQNMLPRWFMAVSPRFGTPVNAILFYAVTGMMFGLWAGFEVLAAAGILTRLLTYLVSAAALPVLERREGRMVASHAIVATLALASSAWVATHADATAWSAFAALTGIGTLLYFVARRQGAREMPQPG